MLSFETYADSIGMQASDILSRCRKQEPVTARQVWWYQVVVSGSRQKDQVIFFREKTLTVPGLGRQGRFFLLKKHVLFMIFFLLKLLILPACESWQYFFINQLLFLPLRMYIKDCRLWKGV